MFLSRLSAVSPLRPSLAALLAAALLSACASPKPVDETAGWSPEKIYSEAMEFRSTGMFDKSIALFEKLEGRAAGTPLAQQAQLEKAYAHYKNGEQAQAVVTLDRFIKLHPVSPALDYALYLKGIVNFNDNLGLFGGMTQQNLSERDQKAAKISYESFRELVQRFPDSKYAADARARMTYVVNSLAESEVNVARYYFSRGAYLAAINRAQLALTDYQGVPAAEQALSIMVRSYEALGMQDLAQDTRRVLEKNFPAAEAQGRQLKPRTDPWWKIF
jgi:outer membrane protein assembly factor BamD